MKFPLTVALLFSLAATMPSFAEDRMSEESIVRSLDDQERAAALARDVATLERLWSDQFTVNSPTNEVVTGRRAVLDAFVRGGVINFDRFDRDVEFLRIEGDYAFLMGAEVVRRVGDTPTSGQVVHRRFTNVWKKEGGTWRLFARHANNIAAPRRP